ncbi:sensor domain-containing diguanylate cyclase [Vibrio nitrifigilis]|uniref:Diguanylate cyclase n=1 Tax=Vibrio nitrifigilis TaxID=2789781 RepID=A0ABS0GJ33_9VIBR|nr:diguanylate cyclase [Vibrio nitrifigilis]MBF9002441.1 diguanylate cyclase [Vibrio nitrifigilis]
MFSLLKFKNFGQFMMIWAVLSIVPCLYFYKQFQEVTGSIYSMVQSEHGIKLKFSKQNLLKSTKGMLDTFHILSDSNILQRAINSPNNTNIEVLEDFWRALLYSQNSLESISLLNLQGLQLINLYMDDANVHITPQNQLININQKEIFKKIQALPIHSSTILISLPQEANKTSRVHLVTPLQSGGQKRGYLFADINVDQIYDNLIKQSNLSTPEVIDSHGNYLISDIHTAVLNTNSDQNDQIGYQNLKTLSPSVWDNIKQADSGSFKTQLGWYSFVRVPLHILSPHLEDIYLLDSIGHGEIEQKENERYASVLTQVGTIIALMGGLAVFFLTWNRKHNHQTIESKLALTVMEGMSALVITDKYNRIIKVNSQFSRLSGYQLHDVKGQHPSMFASGLHTKEFYKEMWNHIQQQGFWEGEVTNKRKDGKLLTELLRIQTIVDDHGDIRYYVASFVDITERKVLENKLREQSERDSLTHIPNRRKFDQVFRYHCQHIKRYPDQYKACFAICDIDHFKVINDTKGHAYGDHVIQSVAHTIKTAVRETDFIARIGGEEFAVILPHTDLKEAQEVLDRVRVMISNKHHHKITISIGFSELTSHPEDSYQRADMALYESKECGRNRVSCFSSKHSEPQA